MNNFTNFIKQNKNKISQISENNIIRNDDGVVVIAKDDEYIDNKCILSSLCSFETMTRLEIKKTNT